MTTAHEPAGSAALGLDQATAFLWHEADLLDQRDYDAWLTLWTDGGLYVIPTDRLATDFDDVLNIAYDDAAMRRARAKRLQSAFAMSIAGAAVTVRTVSRFRILSADRQAMELRCAQHVAEYKFGVLRLLAADVDYRLVLQEGVLRLDRKVVRLVNADEPLHGLGYLL